MRLEKDPTSDDWILRTDKQGILDIMDALANTEDGLVNEEVIRFTKHFLLIEEQFHKITGQKRDKG
jgi:hypothetical protein